MKNYHTLILVFLSFYSNSQVDYQWLVRDGRMKTNLIYNNQITTNVHTHNISSPKKTLPNDTVICANDFLIIFEKGDFIMSNREQRNPVSVPKVPGDKFSYILKGVDSVKYMYLSNIYEEDDPPDETTLMSGTNPGVKHTENLDLFSWTKNEPWGYITNHDIVNGKDVTIILDSNNLGSCPSSSQLKLCYDAPGLTLLNKSFLQNEATSYNCLIVNDNRSIQTDNLSFVDDCISFTLNGRKRIFLNFKSNYATQSSDSLRLFIKDPSGNTCFTPKSDAINGQHHDPNFVKLNCVWEENGKKYGIYRVECYNDGEVPVPRVTLEAQLPYQAIYSSVKVLNWFANNNTGCGINHLQRIDTINSIIKVLFPNGLDRSYAFQKTPKNTAWFEFKVEFVNGTNLYFDDLSVTVPFSYFEKDPYFISTFYDSLTCYNVNEIRNHLTFPEIRTARTVENSMRSDGDGQELTENQYCVQARVVSDHCNYNCECDLFSFKCNSNWSWWKIILLSIVGLILLKWILKGSKP